MKDRFKMTKEQNLFLAKKVLVSSIYNSAKIEGINTTYPDTQTILEGVNVPTMKLDEINCILNLRDAWKFCLSQMDHVVDLDFICKINAFVSRNESLEWGVLRKGKVGINGVDYVPDIPSKEEVTDKIQTILKEENTTIRALRLMLYIMRSQLFWDGNKRTSMIVANKILIENGCGLLTIKEEYIHTFNTLLSDYYNTNQEDELLKFLYNHCLFGLEL